LEVTIMAEKITFKDLVAAAVKLREKKKALDDAYKAKLAPINTHMAQIEAVLARVLDQQGVSSLNAAGYTVYQSHLTSVTTADKEAFLAFVRSQDAWHLLDARPMKAGVTEYVEQIGTPPPGLNVSITRNINIRKS
jgi:hypothetical protein